MRALTNVGKQEPCRALTTRLRRYYVRPMSANKAKQSAYNPDLVRAGSIWGRFAINLSVKPAHSPRPTIQSPMQLTHPH